MSARTNADTLLFSDVASHRYCKNNSTTSEVLDETPSVVSFGNVKSKRECAMYCMQHAECEGFALHANTFLCHEMTQELYFFLQ